MNQQMQQPVLQQFKQYRLAREEALLNSEDLSGLVVLPAGTLVTYGGPVQFHPDFMQVAAIYYKGISNYTYVGVTPCSNLLPLETPEEREIRVQHEAMCGVIKCAPDSVYGDLVRRLAEAGCQMPLTKTKE